MTENLPLPAGNDASYAPEPTLKPAANGLPPVGPPSESLPFSKAAIWGFALSCLSIFVFGFVGALGASISARGFQAARRGAARGRGLAIAGMIIGTIGFLYYAITFIVVHITHA